MDNNDFKILLNKFILNKMDEKYDLKSGQLTSLLNTLKAVKQNELTFFKDRKNYHKIKAEAFQEVIDFIEYIIKER